MFKDNSGYSPKDLQFDDEGRLRLISGVTKMSKAVKSTLGPSGQTVLIESPNHTHGITVTKDGVTVAKAVDLIDPVENLAVRMMKEASDRTASEAGDGTTTAIVLTEALVCSFYDNIDRHGSANTTEALRHLGKYTQDIIKHLESISEPLTDKRLLDVATISSNNDTSIGEIIAKVYKAVGKDGIVTVENSQSSETTFETTHGIKIDKGYTAPLFINDHTRDECILEDCNIMVSDAEVSSVLQIEKILNHIIPTGKRLLIIAPVSQQVTNTLAANVMKNGLKVCVISPPNFGYKQHELMQDIAAAVGATYFSEKTGDDLSLMEPTDLGIVSKAVIGRESTILLQSSKKPSEELSKRIAQLRGAIKKENKKIEKEFIRSRIATLTGGIGVIHVGGQTDLEQKELFDRVDDAVCAVRSALEEGILPGAGMALYNSIEACLSEGSDIEPKEMARQVLSKSLIAPIEQILINAGRRFDDVYYRGWYAGDKAHPKEGYDVKNSKYGNLIDMGVIDPLKVTKVALQNAVSVATTILSTNAIITMARSLEKE
jgi:chaperonin GroEL